MAELKQAAKIPAGRLGEQATFWKRRAPTKANARGVTVLKITKGYPGVVRCPTGRVCDAICLNTYSCRQAQFSGTFRTIHCKGDRTCLSARGLVAETVICGRLSCGGVKEVRATTFKCTADYCGGEMKVIAKLTIHCEGSYSCNKSPLLQAPAQPRTPYQPNPSP